MRYALCLSLALTGCSLFHAGNGLEVQADPPTLVFENTSERAVYFMAIENDLAARINIRFGDVTGWPSVPAGETRRLSYDRIDGYEEGDTGAIVYWSFGERVRSLHTRL